MQLAACLLRSPPPLPRLALLPSRPLPPRPPRPSRSSHSLAGSPAASAPGLSRLRALLSPPRRLPQPRRLGAFLPGSAGASPRPRPGSPLSALGAAQPCLQWFGTRCYESEASRAPRPAGGVGCAAGLGTGISPPLALPSGDSLALSVALPCLGGDGRIQEEPSVSCACGISADMTAWRKSESLLAPLALLALCAGLLTAAKGKAGSPVAGGDGGTLRGPVCEPGARLEEGRVPSGRPPPVALRGRRPGIAMQGASFHRLLPAFVARAPPPPLLPPDLGRNEMSLLSRRWGLLGRKEPNPSWAETAPRRVVVSPRRCGHSGSGWLDGSRDVLPGPGAAGKVARAERARQVLALSGSRCHGEAACRPGTAHPSSLSLPRPRPGRPLLPLPALCSLQVGRTRRGAWREQGDLDGVQLRRQSPAHRVLPRCHPRSGEGVSPGRSSAWSSVNLVFSLKRVWECFPPTSLRAVTSGLAAAPALVCSLGKKTRSLLIQREGERDREERERGYRLIFTLQSTCPHFLILASLDTRPALDPSAHTVPLLKISVSIFFFFSVLKDGVKSCFCLFFNGYLLFPM